MLVVLTLPLMVIFVGINPNKHSTYSIEERQEMLQRITANFLNVTVSVFENEFLVNYASSIDASFIVRGIRSGVDYEYERAIRYINADLQPNIQTVFSNATKRKLLKFLHTMVKGLVGPKDWQQIVRRYVPPAVYDKIILDKQT